MKNQSSNWEIHKFGGTSLDGAKGFLSVVERLKEGPQNTRKAIIVSSMAGGTDILLRLLDAAQNREHGYIEHLHQLKGRQLKAGQSILSESSFETFAKSIKQDVNDIEQILRACWLLQRVSQDTKDWVIGFGEIWSARLLSAKLSLVYPSKPTLWLNARDTLFVKNGESATEINWERSQRCLEEWLRENPTHWLVITGFIASMEDGGPTTLKRDGSDFSASIFGALLGAKALTIWTDVDGVFSADPRRVPEAELIPHMSWQEATELAYFGANVLHPLAMAPAIKNNIPITIRNSFCPAATGTHIESRDRTQTKERDKPTVKGFSTVDNMALINVEGAGMIGVPGVAHRLFGALREVGVSVVMISQASSEHSICFAVPCEQSKQACDVIREAFYRELERGMIQTIETIEPCSILAAVGDEMVKMPGVAAQFFDSLGKAGINIRAIAQGSSERNISAVIDQKDSTRALRAVHGGFFLSQQTLSVGLIGPGLIGQAFLKQLRSQIEVLNSQFNIDLRIRGIANSSKMLLGEQPISLDDWERAFDQTQRKANLEIFAKHIKTEHLPHCVMIDCSASKFATGWYPNWLKQGIHVITPNKKAFSSEYSIYQEIRSLARRTHTHAFYEATVGAGLPIISTLRDLLQTGDEILQIEGVFSGTLSYIFNSFSQDLPFSSVVKRAKEQGYTEPDPRDDLSGVDVARKLVILAREMGLSFELESLKVENLVSQPLQKIEDVGTFMAQLPQMDEPFLAQLKIAHDKGEVLRYVGVINCQDKTHPTAKVALKSYPKEHPFAGIQGSDNIIAFRTKRYDQQPLIIRGPGAGPDVTAGGVFADLLRLAAHLGAPS